MRPRRRTVTVASSAGPSTEFGGPPDAGAARTMRQRVAIWSGGTSVPRASQRSGKAIRTSGSGRKVMCSRDGEVDVPIRSSTTPSPWNHVPVVP